MINFSVNLLNGQRNLSYSRKQSDKSYYTQCSLMSNNTDNFELQSKTQLNKVHNLNFKGKVQLKTTEELIELGESIMKSIPELSSSTSQALYYRSRLISSDCPEYIKDNIINTQAAINKLTRRIRKAENELIMNGRYPRLDESLNIAKKMIIKSGVGNCQQSTELGAAELINRGFYNFRFIETRVSRAKPELFGVDDHFFMVLHNGKPPDIDNLKNYKDGVFLDIWNKSIGTAEKEIDNIEKNVLLLSPGDKIYYNFNPRYLDEKDIERLKEEMKSRY